MRQFQFRLESLLKYRRHRRDLLQSLYSSLLARKVEMHNQQSELSRRRERQLSEMREHVAAGTVNIDAAASRRYHTAQISAGLLVHARDLEQLQHQLDLCRQELTAAERDVKSIEKLKDRQRREFEYDQNRREQHELEDSWTSSRAGRAMGLA